jgi:hypothetical protein
LIDRVNLGSHDFVPRAPLVSKTISNQYKARAKRHLLFCVESRAALAELSHAALAMIIIAYIIVPNSAVLSNSSIG